MKAGSNQLKEKESRGISSAKVKLNPLLSNTYQ